jgi:hypothetical protein
VHIKGGMNVVIEAGVSLTIKVGGNFVNINPAGRFHPGHVGHDQQRRRGRLRCRVLAGIAIAAGAHRRRLRKQPPPNPVRSAMPKPEARPSSKARVWSSASVGDFELLDDGCRRKRIVGRAAARHSSPPAIATSAAAGRASPGGPECQRYRQAGLPAAAGPAEGRENHRMIDELAALTDLPETRARHRMGRRG